jgi:hypothetical protein
VPAVEIREQVPHEAIVASDRLLAAAAVVAERLPLEIAAVDVAVWPRGRIARVSWLMIALLALAVAAVIGAEWPRLTSRYGAEARARRERARRKAGLKIVRTETEEFAASVERDLAELPTIEESDRRKR